METPHKVSRKDWNYREARCSACGLHLNTYAIWTTTSADSDT